jgi:hypothetical protein
MVKIADVLQIVSLYKKCVEVGGDLINVESAPRLAAETVELQLGGELEPQVLQMAGDAITPCFMSYEPKDLAVLPARVLEQLLRRSDLEVTNEDVVFRFLVLIGNDFASDPEYPNLWKCCRLEELSRESILEAANVPHLPKEAFAWALAQKCPSWSSQPLAPPSWVVERVGAGLRGREIVFFVSNPLDYQNRSALKSPEHQMDDNFKWSLLIFPMGTEITGTQKQLAAFVELIPEASLGETWNLKGVRYEITLVNWKDEQRSLTKEHIFTFHNHEVDNGWHRGWVTPDMLTHANGWLNEQGELGFRARICARQAVLSQTR